VAECSGSIKTIFRSDRKCNIPFSWINIMFSSGRKYWRDAGNALLLLEQDKEVLKILNKKSTLWKMISREEKTCF
jgi:hypothetical protein